MSDHRLADPNPLQFEPAYTGSALHCVKEFAVVLGRLYAIEKELDRLDFFHRM
jgi:hypothetical protein